MQSYCGIDIIEVERVKSAILTTLGFKEKVFSKREIEVGDKKSENTMYQYYAGRFAAKEAVYKALSFKFKDKLWLGDIEVLNDNECNNRPYVNIIQEEVKALLEEEKIILDVSISHIKEYAVANASASFMR